MSGRSQASSQPHLPLSCSIPSMEEIGFQDCSLYSNVWVGGETEALRRLPIYCQLRCQQVENTVSSPDYHVTTPISPAPPLQVDVLFDKSALSPYVRFGCLSVRHFLWRTKMIAKTNPAVEKVSKQLMQKLLNREFYFVVASQVCLSLSLSSLSGSLTTPPSPGPQL